MRMFHVGPVPGSMVLECFSPVSWEFGVWPAWQISNRKMGRDEVKEAI